MEGALDPVEADDPALPVRGHAWDVHAPGGKHIWRTLGYRRVSGEAGAVIEWDAPAEFTFPAGDRAIVHGGMVTTLLDTAMGHACVDALEPDETFLTADPSVEFYRSAVPGLLRAEGRVVRRSRRAAFCAAELYDGAGELLAAARCTQILRGSR